MKKIIYPLLLCLAACGSGENPEKPADNPPAVSPALTAPRYMSYSVRRVYPHDKTSFTQGLLVYKGQLYEGTGLEGHSKLMKVELGSGKALQSVALAPEYFGEGVAILNDVVYQLTWQNKVVFAYSLKDLKKIKEFRISTEGWGLTTNGKELILSDGTATLYYYEPGTFRLLRQQSVTENGALCAYLNELEYIDGFIYANQYTSPYILKIDPASGIVVAKADLSDLWNRIRAGNPQADVLNGIAWDQENKKIYITGKLWQELYEVSFGDQ